MVDTNIKIYCLKHPVTLEIRYVGITSKTLKQRLRKHIDNAKYTKHNLHLCNWINSILKLELEVIIELIEEVPFDIWQEKEKYYINSYPNLLNATNGGEGSFGFKHSQEAKDKLRELKTDIKYSQESKDKRSKALKGRIITTEHRAKIGKSIKGRNYTLYDIKVINILDNTFNILHSIQEVSDTYLIPQSTLRRYLGNDKILRGQYKLVKI